MSGANYCKVLSDWLRQVWWHLTAEHVVLLAILAGIMIIILWKLDKICRRLGV